MSRSIFYAPHFNDEAAAYAFVEARIWKDGRVCPHCGVIDRSGPLKGKSNRIGLYKCYACRKPFTVKIGSIFEDSHIQMRDWLVAIHLLCSSKKGISANQLHRTLGVTLKTAWFMGHRIREAMRTGGLAPLGGAGGIVEADETFIGDGSLEGALDQINVHDGANIFHIYPQVGPRRVTCHFPPRLFDDAVAAVGRRIEVFGTLRYRARAPFPHQIAVNDLEIIERESDLPDWEDLLGRAPDATGEKSSEAFIRELRDAWA